MQETTRKYMKTIGMFESALENINALIDAMVKSVGELSKEDLAEVGKLKGAFTSELEPIMEKVAMALEKLVPQETLQKAIEWAESPDGQHLSEVRPILQAYASSLDEELSRRIERRIKELSK
jgi:hypothetical protein